MNLLKLATAIQAHIEGLTGAPDEFPITERDCRRLVGLGSHDAQAAASAASVGAFLRRGTLQILSS